MGKNTVQDNAWLDEWCSDSPPSSQMICWCDRTNMNDTECSGLSKHVITPENIKKSVLANRKVKFQQNPNTSKMSKERVAFIFHQHLYIRKLFSNGMLTVDQQQPFNDSESCLESFRRTFCIDMELWTKLGSTNTPQSQIGSQLSGRQSTNLVQNATFI